MTTNGGGSSFVLRGILKHSEPSRLQHYLGYKGGTIYQLFGYLEIFDNFYKNFLGVHSLSAFKKGKILDHLEPKQK